MRLIDRESVLQSFGCTAEQFSNILTTVPRISQDSYDVTVASIPYTTVVDTVSNIESSENILFICPYCGTHYIARDPGFIPNCYNCGAIMRKGD